MILFLPVILAYAVLMIRWSRVWQKISATETTEFRHPSVAVITAMRNESENIAGLVASLAAQDYPKEQWHFILVDDHSEDDSTERAEKALENSGISYTLLHLPENMEGKKAAIQYGMDHTEAEWVLTTDADCTMGCAWITSMMSMAAENTNMVSGPVTYRRSRGFFSRFLELDLISMVGIGAVTLADRMPLLNNAANMGFRRNVFLEVRPYDKSKKASGDDIFLLRKIAENYPGTIRFVKLQKAIVTSMPPSTLNEFIQQRIRWASKTSSTLVSAREMAVTILLYTTNVLTASAVLMTIIQGGDNVWPAAGILVVKTGADLIFFSSVLPFFGRGKDRWYVLWAEVVHILYVIVFGILGLRGSYRWKSRKLH